jgi:hypothetical protein
MEEFLEVIARLNARADADLDVVRAIHAELTAQVLPRPPLVLPPWRWRGREPR